MDLSEVRIVIVEKPRAESPILAVRAEAPVIEHYTITDIYKKRQQVTSVTVKWKYGLFGAIFTHTIGLPGLGPLWIPLIPYIGCHMVAKAHAIVGNSHHEWDDIRYGSKCSTCGFTKNILWKQKIAKFDKREELGESFTKTRKTDERTAQHKPVVILVLRCFLEDTKVNTQGITDKSGVCSFDMISLLTRLKRPWTGKVIIEATKYPSARVVLSLTEKQIIKILTSTQR